MTPDRQHPDRGYFHERVNHCLCEEAFVRRWENTMKSDSATLSMIIGEHATARDRRVAASLIQWLATNVGWCWLSTTVGEAGWFLSGTVAYRNQSFDNDEFLKVLRQAQLDDKWRNDHDELVRKAFQMMFDLSEPT